ncbi:hypothetical protein TIFTF001_034892 [Ficus carica]|uniref:Uncharacterized protein n=1 Tax=Ficus carica TaxID=3494 RepID=A0AA88E8T7_FICCA|nr:hypothetical protein TIFTF001_034892 [Ficus carica]
MGVTGKGLVGGVCGWWGVNTTDVRPRMTTWGMTWRPERVQFKPRGSEYSEQWPPEYPVPTELSPPRPNGCSQSSSNPSREGCPVVGDDWVINISPPASLDWSRPGMHVPV